MFLFFGGSTTDSRQHLHLMNGVDSGSHDGQIQKETLETLGVGLFHKSNEDSIVEDTVTFLPFTVLDIGPVFIVGVDVGKTCRICLLVQQGGQDIFKDWFFVFGWFLKEDGRHTSIRRHGES